MQSPEPELKALMLASLGGDAAAHRALLDRLSRHLRGYYRRHLVRSGRSAEEAEDLVQEALLAIHLKRHTFDVETLLTPWVHAVARYKLVDYLRRNRISPLIVPIDDHRDLVATDEEASIESTHDLGRLLGKLPEKTRRTIEAVKLEGKTVAETAARYQMSESNVKITIHRGLKALAALIGRETCA
jgi:RNA polymerase sigma-70 factor (ECF subfamily)